LSVITVTLHYIPAIPFKKYIPSPTSNMGQTEYFFLYTTTTIALPFYIDEKNHIYLAAGFGGNLNISFMRTNGCTLH
jgi:hypothetical protein